jgi:hypothetical protein
LQVVGGVLQAVGGIAFAIGGTAGTGGLGAAPAIIGGGLVAARGLDDIQAGLRQLWTGEETKTLTYELTENLTGSSEVATAVDIGTGFISVGGPAKVVSSTDDLARIIDKTGDVAKATDKAGDAANKAGDAAKAGDKVDNVPEYDPRIRQRAIEDPRGHNFPFSFDAQILKTTPTTIRGGGQGYALRGFNNGKEVIYNIIVKDGKIVHRDMISVRNWDQRSKSFGWPIKLEDIPYN